MISNYYYSGKKIYELLPNGDCDIYDLKGNVITKWASIALCGHIFIGEFETVEQAVEKVMEVGYKHYEDLAQQMLEQMMKEEECDFAMEEDDENTYYSDFSGKTYDLTKKNYYVESFYTFDGSVDELKIGYATEEDMARDGDNYVGGGESFSFDVYDDLETAIRHAHYMPCAIEFVGLDEEDEKKKDEIVNRLMKDREFLKSWSYMLDRTVYSIRLPNDDVIDVITRDKNVEKMIDVGCPVNVKYSEDWQKENASIKTHAIVVEKEFMPIIEYKKKRHYGYLENGKFVVYLFGDTEEKMKMFLDMKISVENEEDDIIPF